MQTGPLIIERFYHAPVERVWAAITDNEQMKEWYFDLPAFEPKPGFEFTFTGGSETMTYVHLCRVIEVIPGKKIAYSWEYKGYPGYSVVTFELFPEGDKTKLVLTHTGLESFPGDNPDFARESFTAGWTAITANLSTIKSLQPA